jgi:two-component system cell cycle sensor histidine kinase/response regulator CckA
MSATTETQHARVLAERLPLVTYTVGLRTSSRSTFGGPHVERLFGWTPEECRSHCDFWASRIHPDDVHRYLAAFARTCEMHEPLTVEYRVRTSAGAEVWVRDVGEVGPDDDGELCVHGFLTDINREKELERELAAHVRAHAEASFRDAPVEAERQYRRLIEQLPLVTYVCDVEPEPRATYVSPQIEALFGYPAHMFIDDETLWDRLVHPDDLERVLRVEEDAHERHERSEVEYRAVRADGSVVWVLDLMETVYDDGGPAFRQGFLIDITVRKENERLFRAVFDNAFESMVIVDNDARNVDVNPAACELFGRSREELLGMRIGDLSGEFAEGHGGWETFLAIGASEGSFMVAQPGGDVREAEYAARANVLPGRHLSVLRDVTQRKGLERELWRAQRLESVGRLAGGVAHDFNNLLTAIRGYAQLLLARTPSGTVEHHHAGEIDHAADRAGALTAQLLAFGRRQVLQPRAIDLNGLVEHLSGMLSRLTGAELVLELDPSLHAVRADPAQIEQVLVNLVANAADAAPDGGRVIVRTANADLAQGEMRELPAGGYAVLSVEDSGPGLDETTLERIFEPFFTTKGLGEGVGLGLATAYGIACQSGGTIAVTSAPGAGATFSVFLPEAEIAVSEDARS